MKQPAFSVGDLVEIINLEGTFWGPDMGREHSVNDPYKIGDICKVTYVEEVDDINRGVYECEDYVYIIDDYYFFFERHLKLIFTA